MTTEFETLLQAARDYGHHCADRYFVESSQTGERAEEMVLRLVGEFRAVVGEVTDEHGHADPVSRDRLLTMCLTGFRERGAQIALAHREMEGTLH